MLQNVYKTCTNKAIIESQMFLFKYEEHLTREDDQQWVTQFSQHEN